MNIFNRIGNVFGAGKSHGNPQGATAGQTLAAASRGETMPTPIQTSSRIAPSDADPFIAKFTAPPYFENPVWRFNRWTANPPKIPVALAEWFLSELNKRGDGLSDTEKKELIEIAFKWDALDEKICETGFLSSINLLNKQRDAVRAELDAGKSIPPGRIQSREEFYQQSLTTRAECRILQTQLSRRVFAILNPFCERVRKLARELTQAQDAVEHKANRFGFDHRPSDTMRSLIYLALAGYAMPVSNFMPEFPSLRSWPDWFGVNLFELPKNEKAMEAARKKLADEQVWKNSGHERQPQRDVANTERSKTEHEAAVAELNKKNDAIRTELETESARIRNQKSEAVGAAILRTLGGLIPPAVNPPQPEPKDKKS